jgi:hypothetical protein
VLSLFLAATLAANARPVAVVSTSKRAGADAYTQRTSDRVQLALLREGVPGLLPVEEATKRLKGAGITDPRTCQAARACVGKLALILGDKGVVVSVDTARAGSSLVIVLEAISGDGPRLLTSTELTLPVDKESDEAALPIVLFARQLKEKLDAEAPKEVVVAVKPDDTPTKTNLEPPPPAPPLLEASNKSGPGRTVGGVMIGTAAASGATAIILAIVSGTAKAEYDGSLNPEKTSSTLPQSKIDDLQGRANGGATGALISGIGAVALGVVGVILLAGN